MKKMLIVLMFVFSLFSVSCNLIGDGFNASMKDFFDENLGTARIIGALPLQQCNTGSDVYLNIPSNGDFSIKLSLYNPQGYKFELGKNLSIKMSDESVDADLNFQGNPDNLTYSYNIYSDPQDKTNSTLILHFTTAFLRKWESGGDISPIITLSHPLSDALFESYDKLKLRSNSPPPPVSDMVISNYLNEQQQQCLRITFAMPSAEDLSGIHKDINKINIRIESEGKIVSSKDWNVKIETGETGETGETFYFYFYDNLGVQNEECFKYGGGYEDKVTNSVTFFSDVSIASHPKIVCSITLYDEWGLKAEACEDKEYSLAPVTTITENEYTLPEYTGGRLEFAGNKLTLNGVSAENIEMTKEGASLCLSGTISISEVKFGTDGQTVVLKDFELEEGAKPIKISIAESYKEGDVILVPAEGASLTQKDIESFEIDSEEFIIELKDGGGVISKKPEQGSEIKPDPPVEVKPDPPVIEPDPPVEITIKPFEITLPVTEEYNFTIKTKNGIVSEKKIEVKLGGEISFDVATKDGKPVQNETFEIRLMQNGDVFKKDTKEIVIDDEIPLDTYDVYMSVEIDGIKLDKMLPVEVVSN